MTTHVKDLSQIASRPVSLPGHSVKKHRFLTYRTHYKRAIDIMFVLAAAPIAIPIIVIMAMVSALDGASPFYHQRRIGRAGQPFRMMKIRTMVPNAHDRLEAYLASNPAAREEWNTTQKLKKDPRITPIGRLLRKSSLDELPQLWNVLRGDMSIVGPRPMMADQIHLYPGTEYYALRPGITGPWQVSDRNHTTFAQRALYDAEYYETLSFRTDVRLVLGTVGVVARCTGY